MTAVSKSRPATSPQPSHDAAAADCEASPSARPPPPPTWLSLPHKRQLIILALCRLSEPLAQTSLLSYLYFFLGSLPGSSSPSIISRRAGVLASSFAFSQCLTGVLWGRLSDCIGRKPCILLGLLGTTISIIGFGFSERFETALAWRILGGILNGNVGVLRTMVAETVREKRHQPRAFLIMPMCFNIGIIVGPALGGLLADPASWWGWWVWERWRWALPNIVCAGFLVSSWVLGVLFLEETLESRKDIPNPVRQAYTCISRSLRRCSNALRLSSPPGVETAPLLPKHPSSPLTTTTSAPPLRQILTPNILATLLSFTLLPLHNATFMHLFPILLSTPRNGLHGGLSLSSHQVGLILSNLGIAGIFMQLFVYPSVQFRLGLLRSFRIACCIFPLAYLLAPLLPLLPANSLLMWAGIASVLGTQVSARTFALPGSVILLTNSVEGEGLGTVNGIGASLSSAARAVGPVAGALGFAKGLEGGVGVGGVFWGLAGVAGVAAAWGMKIKEGRGRGI